MKKKLLIGMAVIGASVAVLGGCGGSATTGENSASTTNTTETQNNSSEFQNVIEEPTKEGSAYSYNYYTGHYEGDYISFDIPEGWYVKELVKYGDQKTKATVCNKTNDNRENTNIEIIEDSLEHSVKKLYKDATDAESACMLRKDSMIDSGYVESEEKLPGNFGVDLIDVDGQVMYAVWDVRKFLPALNYMGFIDSPKGTLIQVIYGYMEDDIDYGYTDDQTKEERQMKTEQLINSIKFK